nr:ribokinase [Sphingomonadaceae bacterium]
MTTRASGTVAVLGSINMDSVFRVSQFPQPGETILAMSVSQHAGGKGLNQAIAAARAGAEVRMIGAVGDDAAGRILLDVLIGENIDCSAIGINKVEATGIAQIVVDGSGENQIIVVAGANAKVSCPSSSGVSVLLAQLEIPID